MSRPRALENIRVVDYHWAPDMSDERQDGFQQEAVKLRDRFIDGS